ncbi:MAG: fibronectin type III domain-containing protein [Betaproteobacteria bacterium]|nr:fibronectin type III domain-containing protein [Betaproteobacteria bacterium]
MKTALKAVRQWQRMLPITGAFLVAAFIGLALTACGGGGGTTTSLTALPAAPTSLTVVGTTGQTLSATVTWSPPTSGGEPTSYEVYRSTSAGATFSSDYHVISIPVVAGQTSYTFIDNAGLTAVDTYWVVSAKNAGGETPSAEIMYTPIGPSSGGGSGGDTGFGNNLAAALIFADGYGITGLPLTGTWTSDVAAIDFNTGVRPAAGILPSTVTTLPYFDSADTYSLDGATYYKNGTASTWQGQWANGAGTLQHVTAAWGDNLLSQKFTTNSTIRIEMVLSEALTTPMKAYTMKSLYGTNLDEVFGTDTTTYDSYTALVFAANAHLAIQKVDSTGKVLYTAYDGTLWQGDGPGNFGAEINVGGNFTYGYVWQPKNMILPSGVTADGTWRITFSLDSKSPVETANNTSIDTTTNGVLDSSTQVHVDINVAPK